MHTRVGLALGWRCQSRSCSLAHTHALHTDHVGVELGLGLGLGVGCQ